MGIFRLKAPFSEAMGNGSFLTPKPSFPGFGDFDPCTVPTLSQCSSNLYGDLALKNGGDFFLQTEHDLVAWAIRNTIRANRFARIDIRN